MQPHHLTTEPGLSTVTNSEFLRAVADGKVTDLWVCNFARSPEGAGGKEWAGSAYTSGAPLRDHAGENTYFSTAALKPAPDREGVVSVRRLGANFDRLLVLVADDARVKDLKAPASYVLRTSTNKRQIGYLLKDTPETRDLKTCQRAMKLLRDRGLVGQDKSGNNPVRYGRLPVGTNTKYPDRPRHQLEVWNPELRYTLAEALAGFGVDQDAAAPTTSTSTPVPDTGEWVDDARGRLDVDQASDDIITGAVFHDSLTRLAAHYATKGMGVDEIDGILRELMDRSAGKGNERWSREMAKLRDDTIASAVSRFGSTYSSKVDFTDRGNANLLAKLTNGDLRYVVEQKAWIAWTGGRWDVDASGERAFAASGLVGEHYAKEGARLALLLRGVDTAAAKQHQKTIDTVNAWEKACRGRRGIENFLALAKMHPAFVIVESELDTDPHLLGVQNGVVDLRTGTLRPDAREDFVTRRCAYAYRPGAVAPRWDKFIGEVTGYPIAALVDAEGEVVAGTVGRFTPRPGYAAYLQRALGYSCTALTVEHKMFTVFGEHGSNGKNALFDAVKKVLAGYATTASEKLLLSGRREADANSATPAVVALKGSRLAVASEPPMNSTFDNTVVKALTGEVKVAGRALNCGAGEIAVTWHLWLLCNAKPKVEHLEQAVVGRILMLPFDMRWNRPGHPEHDAALPDADKGLSAALDAESEGILAWLVAGAVAYFKEGLTPCAEVITATRTYFDEQRVDPVGQWLAEHERCTAAVGMHAKAAFDAFNAWRVAQETAGLLEGGAAPSNPTAFAAAMKRLGVSREKHGVIRYGVKAGDVADEFPDVPDVPDWAHEIA